MAEQADVWQRIQTAFESALGISPGAARDRFLILAFPGDPELEQEVRAMIDAHESDRRLRLEERILVADPPAQGDLDGSMIGPYKLIRRIGRGGMGEVYEARKDDPELTRPVALKLLSNLHAPELAQRFRHERFILGRLAHPNIAPLLDGGVSAGGRPYLVMPLVSGEPITGYCRARGLGVEARLRLFLQVARAVAHAHRMLVVHRDIKPSNILVTNDGQVTLLDFGIAKLIDPSGGGEHPVTRAEMQLMTPEYAAPEQLTGGAITTATDVHGLGLLLYELLTGQRAYPLGDSGRLDWERRVATEDPAPPSRHDRSLRGDLDAVILKAIAKEPERRYPSVTPLAADVEAWLSGRPVEARTPSAAYRLGKFVRRNRLATAFGSLATVLLLALVVVSWLQSRRVSRERDAAVAQEQRAESVVRVLTGLIAASNPKYLPGGRELTIAQFLEKMESTLFSESGLDPAVKAQLQRVLGQVYMERSQFDRARTFLDQAVTGLRAARGDGDPATVEAVYDRARLAGLTEAPPVAQARLRDALDRIRRAFGPNDHRVAAAIAELLKTMEPAAGYLSLAAEALEIEQRIARTQGPSPGLAQALMSMAAYHNSREEFEKSLDLLGEARRIIERVEPEGHPDRWDVLGRIALVYDRLNQPDRSIELQRQVLDLQRRYMGDNGNQIAVTINDLGVSLFRSGRFAEGEACLRDAYERFRRIYPPDHRELSNSLRNIGRALQYQRRHQEALAYFRQALAMERRLNSTEVSIRSMESRLAQSLIETGQRAEGLRMLTAATERLRQVQPGGYWAADASVQLGFSLLDAGRREEAAARFRFGMQHRAQTLDAGHPKLAEARCGLAAALAGLKPSEESARLQQSCDAYFSWPFADPAERDTARRFLASLR